MQLRAERCRSVRAIEDSARQTVPVGAGRGDSWRWHRKQLALAQEMWEISQETVVGAGRGDVGDITGQEWTKRGKGGVDTSDVSLTSQTCKGSDMPAGVRQSSPANPRVEPIRRLQPTISMSSHPLHAHRDRPGPPSGPPGSARCPPGHLRPPPPPPLPRLYQR